MSLIKISLKSWSVYSRTVKTRIPFRFGKSLLKEMPIIHLKVALDLENGEEIEGYSATGIPPLWFDKDDSKTDIQHQQNLLYSLKTALESYQKAGRGGSYSLHQNCEESIVAHGKSHKLNDLTASFGQALLDNAIVDAICRLTKKPFLEILKSGELGFPHEIEEFLPEEATEAMSIRHTIGLLDEIHTSDIKSPLNDGLPESLEEVLAIYNVNYLKVKVTADVTFSIERLKKIAKLITPEMEMSITLDGNEQFSNMADFRKFYQELSGDPELNGFFNRVIWIEEPIQRKFSLDDSVKSVLDEGLLSTPIIIDESGGSKQAFPKAVELGYKGVSAKNCKGVYRTLETFVEVKKNEIIKGTPYYMSSEDLTNVPVLPFHQDICVAAALGITHSERNGHHFIRGFDFLSSVERREALKEFPSLYKEMKEGTPVLNIQEGKINLKELNQVGFGAMSKPDFDFLSPVELPTESC